MLLKDRLDLARGIEAAIEQGTAAVDVDTVVSASIRSPRSHYLGMSSIGKCAAELWKHYHEKPDKNFDARIQRIFDTGHVMEAMVEEYIKHSDDLELIATQRAYSDLDGKFRGHSDWLVRYKPLDVKLLLDGKTMNMDKFAAFSSAGAAFSHPDYVVQGNMYSGYEGTSCYGILAINKNDCNVYVEIFPFDMQQFDYHRSKAKLILASPTCPPCEFVGNRMRWCDCKRRKQ